MRSKKILLVEDNPSDVMLIQRALRLNQLTHELIVAEDGAEALDYLFATGPHEGRDLRDIPTVMLLDLKLPKIDGLEVLRRIRADEVSKRLPVVVFTSSDQEADLIASYNMGANSYVRKPVDFRQLGEVVRDLCTYWLRLNELPPAW